MNNISKNQDPKAFSNKIIKVIPSPKVNGYLGYKFTFNLNNIIFFNKNLYKQNNIQILFQEFNMKILKSYSNLKEFMTYKQQINE